MNFYVSRNVVRYSFVALIFFIAQMIYLRRYYRNVHRLLPVTCDKSVALDNLHSLLDSFSGLSAKALHRRKNSHLTDVSQMVTD